MTTRKKPARKKRPPKEPASKSEATRQRLLERALELFQQRGVEATTMRDIAKAAGLSLGAAYYYFPSKEALVFAYYEANQLEAETDAERATGSVRERLGAIFHAKLDSIRPQRKMLRAILPRLIDPGDPLSAFSSESRAVRERSIAVLERVVRDTGLPDDVARLVADSLWLMLMAAMLVFVGDDSPGEKRTHGLVDDGLDLLVPMLPLLGTPMGRALCERIVASLRRAGIGV